MGERDMGGMRGNVGDVRRGHEAGRVVVRQKITRVNPSTYRTAI